MKIWFQGLTLTLFALSTAAVVHADNGDPSIRLTTQLDKPVLLAGKKQTAHLKIGLAGVKIADKGERSAVNIALVIDRSGSMSGEKIRQAKRAAELAVGRMGSDDIVSVIAYDSTVEVLVPATKIGDGQAVIKRIRQIRANGSTALFAGVSKGAHELRKFIDRDRVNRIILLSDGLANVGPSSPGELERLGLSLAREGISVTTLGLGLQYNEDLMYRLARASDGNHVFVERASDLARFFKLEFGDILSVVAQEISVEINCAPGVRPVRVLGRSADIIGSKVTAHLRQVYGGREKFLMLELEMPAGQVGEIRKVADVQIGYSNMLRKSNQQQTGTVSLSFAADSREVAARENREVTIQALELISTERNRMALVLRDQGRIADAEKVLRQNIDWLDKNRRRYKSKRLRILKDLNNDDAKNLAPRKWKEGRKKMRRHQYRFDMQQNF